MSKISSKDRLREIFESTLEADLKYEGPYDQIDYYKLFCKATAKDLLHKVLGNHLCMYNCCFEGDESILMIFSIPINAPEESGTKNVAEKVMEIVELLESCFTTLDMLKSEEVRDDKFIYVTAIKKVNGKE